MKIEIVNVTKDMAKHWLVTSKGNPRWSGKMVEPNRVKYYANKMNRGFWQLSPEPITFDTEGHLVDGHHRLSALLASNVDFLTMTVATNCECTVFDDNMKRTESSLSRAIGSPLANTEISIARCAIACICGLKHGRSVPIEEACKFASDNPEVNLAYSLARSSSLRNTPFAMCMFGALKCGVPFESLQRFCDVVRSGLPENEAEFSAVKCAQHIKLLGHINQDAFLEKCAFVEYYLYSYINNNSIKKITNNTKHYFISQWLENMNKEQVKIGE